MKDHFKYKGLLLVDADHFEEEFILAADIKEIAGHKGKWNFTIPVTSVFLQGSIHTFNPNLKATEISLIPELTVLILPHQYPRFLIMYIQAFRSGVFPKRSNHFSRLISPGANYKLTFAFPGENPSSGASYT